ncbi:MAG TPA: haloacid dehalogenase-like hydrolase [Pseudonocardiaceae bacterium]|nr:haloacid dehalogenase-like hydrolase [Pseudonocardiaceae bacterium]
MTDSRALVFWDIDLTLIDARRIGASWFRTALTEVTGEQLTEIPSFAGRTDRWITAEMLRRIGRAATEDEIDAVQRAVIALADRQHPDIAEVAVELPGVSAALRAIAGLPGVVQSLVTGNLAPVAAYKVAAFGLDTYLDLPIGGYGEVSELRADLLGDALAKATAKYGEFAPDAVFVIGDTPHDIDAALAHKARAIAVATGRFSAEELRAAGAHTVLPDLTDTGKVLALLGN